MGNIGIDKTFVPFNFYPMKGGGGDGGGGVTNNIRSMENERMT